MRFNSACSTVERTPLATLSDEYRYKILRLLEADPQMSQRELAQELEVSLGKVNYCLRALIEKGWVKAANFRRSTNKVAYAYLLTPRGIEEKAQATAQFLIRKVAEHEALEKEIEQLRRYVEQGRIHADVPLEE